MLVQVEELCIRLRITGRLRGGSCPGWSSACRVIILGRRFPPGRLGSPRSPASGRRQSRPAGGQAEPGREQPGRHRAAGPARVADTAAGAAASRPAGLDPAPAAWSARRRGPAPNTPAPSSRQVSHRLARPRPGFRHEDEAGQVAEPGTVAARSPGGPRRGRRSAGSCPRPTAASREGQRVGEPSLCWWCGTAPCLGGQVPGRSIGPGVVGGQRAAAAVVTILLPLKLKAASRGRRAGRAATLGGAERRGSHRTAPARPSARRPASDRHRRSRALAEQVDRPPHPAASRPRRADAGEGLVVARQAGVERPAYRARHRGRRGRWRPSQCTAGAMVATKVRLLVQTSSPGATPRMR